MLRINIAPLKPGVHEFSFAPEAEAVGLDAEKFRDVHVQVRLDRSAERIVAGVQAQATATLECDRTLQLFDQPLDGSFTVLFAPPEEIDESGEPSDDLRVLAPTDTEIDLTDIVRDTLLLAIPVRKVAPGAEEMDLPMHFGAPDDGDRSDPRWEALRSLPRESDEPTED